MNLVFDEAGKLQAGRVLSEAEASAQVELDTGKRVKVKAANQLLRFEQPAPADLLAQAATLAATVELPLAWEFAPEDEFGFAELAADYFGGTPAAVQQAAMLLALHGAPHYFRRSGKGRFKKASAEIVAQALAAIEKKKRIAEQVSAWAGELAAGQCPPAIAAQLYKILFHPDKNAPEYKAVVEAARATQLAPLALLKNAGAIESAYQFHWQRFLFDHFPKGTQFPQAALSAPLPAAPADGLPLADVQAYSIDDSQTTEIDDALSVTGLGSGVVTVGVHIAAPGLLIQPGDALDATARARLSTVYMPGHKITMLPDAVVQAFTLDAGRANAALSLYVRVDENTLQVLGHDTRLECVCVQANLRHDQLDSLITAEWLNAPQPPTSAAQVPMPHAQLAFLYRLALHLKAGREQVRGKPENFNRPDYGFRLEAEENAEADAAPTGHERVLITPRKRGAPLDMIVAETMILANSTWGQWLAELGVPGIYRSQASLAPGIKVRMGVKPLPHAGIGVPSYIWSTSPLRRYTDLLNQWQIIACVRHGPTAALAAPFRPKDALLFAVISAFDAAYTAYNQNQAAMERFWTLRYLRQNAIGELNASVIKELPGSAWLVRADDLPLTLTVLGAAGMARGSHVRVKLGAIDDIALDVSGTVIEVMQEPAAENDENDTEDEQSCAGPIAIAVDLADTENDAAAAATTAAAA